MKSQICLSLFVLLVCQSIFSVSQVQASELTAGDFEQIDFLFPIENEETGAALLSSGDTVAVNEEEGVNPGEGNEEAGSGDPDPETACTDKNCATCASVATCTVCNAHYKLVNGGCKLDVPKLNFDLKLGGTMAQYKANGGAATAEEKMTTALKLKKKGLVKVVDAKPGSIILTFDVFVPSDSDVSVTQLKKNLDVLGNSKSSDLDLFDTGVEEYYGVNVVAAESGCPAGQYADANGVCRNCDDGCTYCDSEGKCKKTNVGAIVGGILGGLALIMVIVVAYIKRDVLLKGFSSSPKSPNRAAYYAAGPVSPTEQAPLQA